jgi:hypothetical protein
MSVAVSLCEDRIVIGPVCTCKNKCPFCKDMHFNQVSNFEQGQIKSVFKAFTLFKGRGLSDHVTARLDYMT